MFRSLILIFGFLPLAVGAQPIQMSIAAQLVNDPASSAILVSNQYGVLRYYHVLGEAQEQDLSFSINRRIGEQLSLTLVRAVEDNGFFAFDNITYCNLSNGAYIGKVAEEEEEGTRVFKQIELFVDGVSAVEDVIVTGEVAMQPVYRIIGGRLFVAFSAPPYSGMLLLFKVNEEENYRYFYTMPEENSRYDLSLADLKTDLAEQKISLPKGGDWEGNIQAYDGNTGQYLWVYNGERMRKPFNQEYISAYVPGRASITHFNLELASAGADGYSYYGRYESLPSRLEDFFFDPLFAENQSKAFRFKVSEEEVGQFYEVAYNYEGGRGIPDSHWRVFGAVGQPGEVDFILPDIPAELYDVLPVLDLLLEPTSAVKRMLRCTQDCDYDFSKKPYLLQSVEWQIEHGVQARSQEQDF
ncbi:MAG: hypothetical protein H6557_06930 [Lewinellaceae bacterium]|nr:hypothetical protein [Phaeodactylibacter sp.]MCB9036336.1 hypothetical protein [Lewinellaceae bacterium]